MTAKTPVPFCHLELMSDQAEERIGSAPYILRLTASYATDQTATIIKANLQHSADVLNKTAVRNLTAFPYVALDSDTGFGGKNRSDSWVYLSPKNVLKEVEAVKVWMKKVAEEFHKAGMKIDASKNPATIYKIAWSSTELAKPIAT